jgi:hypothetical protein
MTLGEYLITNFRPGYEATTAAWGTGIILGALILLIAITMWSKRERRQRKITLWLKTTGWIAISSFAVFLAYSAYLYWYSDVATTGLLICEDDTCRVSVHWHATLEEMTVCGRQAERPWETGSLDQAHTHKDNRIHLHTILDVDPATKEVAELDPLSLGHFFDQIGWKFETNCFADRCDTCNGEPAVTKVWVNGEQKTDVLPRDIIWKDGDVIRIAFD